MELKEVLLWISLSLFILGNCQACEHEESNEQNSCPRILRKFSGLFTCLLGDCIGASSQHRYERIDYNEDYEINGLATTEIHSISMLPNAVLYQVSVFLSPPDIISLVKSNKKFSCLKSNNFWIYYNKKHKYDSWSEEIYAIKVAFSHYWFRNNKVRKAATMGFPRALEFLKEQEKLKRENPKSYQISNYSRQNQYDNPYNEIMYFKFFYIFSYKKH